MDFPLYADWMVRWETALTTRDTNRIVRPLKWSLELIGDSLSKAAESSQEMTSMIAANEEIVRSSTHFFSYATPKDFQIEERYPQLFPTNVRPKTVAEDTDLKRKASEGKLQHASYLRFTSPVTTPHAENDRVNARWYPAYHKGAQTKQAMIVMPQWNADAFSHNALCTLFNRFGISCLRLSKPYHDIRRPAELERSDFAVSADIGRTLMACRQGVVDVRSCLDWLESLGYEQFGILGTSLGSCYAFIAAAHDPRIRVCAFNHASAWFGDVLWTGQSTRHIRAAFEKAGLTQEQVRQLFLAISPMSYMDRFAAHSKRVLVVHATYDLTFLREFSLEVLREFDRHNVDYVSKVLPCGHYTTGEWPFKYLDGWYLGSFIYQSFRRLARESAEGR